MKLLGKIPIPQAFKDDLDEFLFCTGNSFLPWFNKVQCQLVLTKTVIKKMKSLQHWNI